MEKQNNSTYLTAFRKFCFDTSVHGFVFLAGKRHRKTWIFLITLSAFYCCYQCKLNIDSYLRYDVKTKFFLTVPEYVTFPAATFCPQVTQKRSTMASVWDYREILAYTYAKTAEEWNTLITEVTKKIVCT